MSSTPLQGTASQQRANRWVAFAGLMMIVGGFFDVLNGLWALDRSDAPVDSLIFEGNLEAWGWFYVILGVVLITAGFAVFARVKWAVYTGIAVSLAGAVIHFFWIFTYPGTTTLIVALNILVLYALTMYGLDEDGAQ